MFEELKNKVLEQLNEEKNTIEKLFSPTQTKTNRRQEN